jgi:hypothetical protein
VGQRIADRITIYLVAKFVADRNSASLAPGV